MPSTNTTVPQTLDSCNFIGSFAWRVEHLTNAAVYINLVITACINGITFPLTAILNGLLIFFIIRRPMLRRKKSTVVIGYQAVTDLAVGIIVQPTFLATELCHLTGQCRICTINRMFIYLTLVTCGSSLDHLLLIAWERYTAIKHALRYRLIVTTNRLLAATIAAWLFEITRNGVFFFGRINGVSILNIITLLVTLICLSTTVYFYTAIYFESRHHRVSINNSTPHQGMNPLREFKAAKTTALVVGCLLTCYAPNCVLVTVSFMFPTNVSMWESIFPWAITFALLNSLINPLLYGWRVQEIRKVVAATFKWQENSLRQELRTDRIEMIEFNNKNTVNPRLVSNAEEFLSCALTDDSHPPRIRRNETELITKTCINSNTEHASKLQLQLSSYTNPNQNIREDTDSESEYGLNECFSERKEIKKEQNQITVTAIVHCNPVTNNEVSESIIEDGEILPERITHQILTTEIAEKESSLACLDKN